MELEYREVGDADLEATLRAQDGVQRLPRGKEEWDWIYRRNPCGRRAFVAMEGEQVRAHCGMLLRRVWAGGKERFFGEVIDAFEATPGRGLYALTARALLESREDPPVETVAYAWPAAAEARVMLRLLGFETVRTEPWLLGAVGTGGLELPAGVERLDRFGEDARWLWDRCSGEYGASAIRDADFLNWRFFDRPGHRYRVLGVRDEGVLRGYAVLAPAREPETVHLVDWLCPAEEKEVGQALLAGALTVARSQGAIVMGGLIVPWSPWFECFQEHGFQVHGRGRFLLARSALRKFDDLWLREGWWYTLADSLADG